MGDGTGLVVNRWRRYGKDRLYVEWPDGTKIGYWDLVADTGHPVAEKHQRALLGAVEDWRVREAATAPVGSPPAVAPEVAESAGARTRQLAKSPVDEAMRPWVDLATNRAGEAAREQALSARGAAPVKTVFARILGVHTDERAWRIGADGEEKVAARIDEVIREDPRWRVLHAIPVGKRGSDIDHLIIGPGGVFTVNAKHHPGAKIWVGGDTFLVDGHKQHYVRNSRYEAARASDLLTAACGFPVHVEGLIVTVNAEDVVIRNQPVGVHVTWRNNLAKWLLRLGPLLADDQVDAVYEAARRSTTWCP